MSESIMADVAKKKPSITRYSREIRNKREIFRQGGKNENCYMLCSCKTFYRN